MPTQQIISDLFGFLPLQPTSVSALALNSTANYIAFAFVAQSTTALSACRFRCAAKNGTGGTINVKVLADASGSPDTGTVIDTLTVGTLTASTWVNNTGGTTALTQGTKYWVAIFNTDGAPATNNISVGFMPASAGLATSPPVATSANTGATWTIRANGGGMRFDFSSVYYGLPVQSASPTTGSTQVFSTNELGVQFTLPSNASPIVAGIACWMNTVTGTPTGNPYFNLRDSSHNLIASTDQIPNADARTQTNFWMFRNFTSGYGNQTLTAGGTYTITLAESTQSDTSSNAFSLRAHVFDSDSNSVALIPWSMQQDFYNGSSWAQTSGTIFSMGLILASGGEFASTGSAGMLYIPCLNGT